MTTKTEIHNKAVEVAACNLIENGITTRNGTTQGNDLVLDTGETIRVRGLREEVGVILMNGSTDTINTDYLMIVTNLDYTIKKIYIMSTDNAKNIADICECERDRCDESIISVTNYRTHRDNYTVLNRGR